MLLAVPAVTDALGASGSQQLWIMDVYGFMVAGFMITMGTSATGSAGGGCCWSGPPSFGVASVLAAYSTSPEMLIVARALLGVAGAAITPSTLSLITTMFPDPGQRATAHRAVGRLLHRRCRRRPDRRRRAAGLTSGGVRRS